MTKSNRPAYRYQAGGSLRANDPTYVYRQADEALYERLKEGDFCYVFNCRQMGKSSLGTQIMGRLIAEGICCVRVDLSAIGTSGVSMVEWYRSLIEALHFDVTEFVEAGVSEATADLDLDAWQAKYEALMRAEGVSAVRLFSRYLKEILLVALPQQRFTIFIDEIDNVLALEDSSDFFGLIRACFNRRADDPDYERLTFALFGVATPGRLIRDVNKTPFNLGKAIVLTGFELDRSLVLTEGMVGVVPDPVAVLREMLAWTGGQPFLTQKLCDWVQMGEKAMPELVAGEEAVWVEQLVQKHLIANWKFEDDPQHFKTIENFILRDVREGEAQKSEISPKVVQLLGLYQQVLQAGEIEADESEAQTDLCLSGLVVRDRGKLRVYNRIYQRVFDLKWVEEALTGVDFPKGYLQQLDAWKVSQSSMDLLQGERLSEALVWAGGRRIREMDNRFLMMSQNFALQEAEIAKSKLDQEIEIIKDKVVIAQQNLQNTEKRIKVGKFILSGVVGLAMIAAAALKNVVDQRQTILEVNRLEKEGAAALRRSEYEQVSALVDAMRAGQSLQALIKKRGSEGFTASPIYALQSILDVVENRGALSPWQHPAGVTGEAISSSASLHQTLLAPGNSFYKAAFSLDGQRIVTNAHAHRQAQLWDAQSGQEIATLKGNEGSILAVRPSPNGQRIVTVSYDNTIRVWDAQSKQVIATLKDSKVSFTEVLFSPDGQRIVNLSSDKTMQVWDVLSGQEIVILKGHEDRVDTAAFSPDGQRIVILSSDKTMRVWDVLSGQIIAKIKVYEDLFQTVEFSPDGQRIVTISSNQQKARVWDIQSGQEIVTLKGHKDHIRTVAFSLDGKRIVTTVATEAFSLEVSESSRIVQVWDAQSGQVIAILKGHEYNVNAATFSPDGQRILTASDDNTARVWDAQSGQVIATLKGHESRVGIAAFSPDGKRIVTASDDNTARVWDAQSGREIAILKGHENDVNTAAFSPDGKRILTTSDDNTMRVWEATTRTATIPSIAVASGPDEESFVIMKENMAWVWDTQSGREIATLKGHENNVNTATFSPDGKHILTTSDDKTARVWDAQSGQEIATLKGHENNVYRAAFSPDGKRILTTSDDKTARVWDAQSGQAIATFKGQESYFSSTAFSPDGKRILTISDTISDDKPAQVWDAQSGQAIATLKGHKISSTATFSPDSQRIVTASYDNMARVWDVQSGEAIAILKGHEELIKTVTFSPDGQRIVTTAVRDKTARVWDAQSGREIVTLKGHENNVNTATFSPDGKRIVTASDDKTARMWDAQSGREIATLKGHIKDVETAAFSPDGQRIVTRSMDGTAKVWPVENLDMLLARGCNWLKNYLIVNPQTLNQLTTCQTPEITQATLPNLIRQSETHAREGRLTEAIQGFTLAKQWNPNLPFDPKTHAEKLAQEAKAKP